MLVRLKADTTAIIVGVCFRRNMRPQNLSHPRAIRFAALIVAFVLSVATGACSRPDADVQADLQRQLAADTATAGITATVTEGVARLSGVTQTKAQQDRAMDISRSVKGVKEVESAMRMDDASLAEAVKTAVAADESVRGIPLRVEATNGEVRLFSDSTNADQRARLLQVAGAVYGVTHVEDNMK
jgi:osmotically-inducible protein OsmY